MYTSDSAPVVVGVDGTVGSQGALRYAVTEAMRLGAPLRLVHTIAPRIPMWPSVPVAVLAVDVPLAEVLAHEGSAVAGSSSR